MLRTRRQTFGAALMLGLVLGAAARTVFAAPDPLVDADETSEPAGFPDPLERVNRATFAFNRKVDAWFFDPVTRAYRFVVPGPARHAVRRVLHNLDAPVTFANDVFQLEPKDAAVTVARFLMNTTLGVAGLFDVAADWAHLPPHESDFGQTLALAGIPSGAYLVLPVLGPTNVRDGTGFVVDLLFRPTTYLLTPGGAVFVQSLIQPGQDLLLTTLLEGSEELAEGLSTREAAGAGLAALEASSVDYYAALRNAYYQTRIAAIWRRGPDHGPLARAKSALHLALGPAGGEVGDLGPHGGDQPLEAVAFQH